MKKVAGSLRLDLAQYRELAAFAQFGSDLDKATQRQLTRGERMVEILKQGQYVPMPLEKQVAIIFAGTQGYLDDVPVDELAAWEEDFHAFMAEKHASVLHAIAPERPAGREDAAEDLSARRSRSSRRAAAVAAGSTAVRAASATVREVTRARCRGQDYSTSGSAPSRTPSRSPRP